MNAPDFMIIGAMKCGTSTLAEQLAQQPDIFMTDPKEPNFFSDDDVYARGEDWYWNLFASAGEGALKGEASTHYTKLPNYPDVLKRINQHKLRPKLIYLIRNPIDRAVSHYIHEWTMRTITAPIEEAIVTHPEIIEYGCYGKQIEPWVTEFGSENILLISLEEMGTDPEAVFGRVGRFLGKDDIVWDRNLKSANVSADRMRRIPLQNLFIDNDIARFLRRSLVPKSIRSRIRRSRQMENRPELSPSTTAELRKTYMADRELLQKYYPENPSTDLPYQFAVQ